VISSYIRRKRKHHIPHPTSLDLFFYGLRFVDRQFRERTPGSSALSRLIAIRSEPARVTSVPKLSPCSRQYLPHTGQGQAAHRACFQWLSPRLSSQRLSSN
jgi:hypothetical protein